MLNPFDSQGKFLQTCQLAENWYGVTREAVENVAREGLAAVFHMDLEVGKQCALLFALTLYGNIYIFF